MFRKTVVLKVSRKSLKSVFNRVTFWQFELPNLPSINILKTVSTVKVSCEFSLEFLKLLGERLCWNHFCEVLPVLVIEETSALYILVKRSVTCISMLQEVALLSQNSQKIFV